MIDERKLKDFLTDATTRAGEDPVALTIRELLSYWGHKRRGYWVVAKLERDLMDHGLRTDPPFTVGWIDTIIRLVPQRRSTEPKEVSQGLIAPEESDESETVPEVSIQVSTLRSSSGGIESVNPQKDLLYAQSLMMRYDYSQLAVQSTPYQLEGAITWESIAQAQMKGPIHALSDCVIQADTVLLEDDLLALIPRINENGFVFVRGTENKICGIVTPADVTDEFGRLARPFFLVGEIERRLRVAIDGRFIPDELSRFIDPDDSTQRDVSSAGDLTLGEHQRILESEVNWKRMDWHAERTVFIQALDSVRKLRNEIMHFSPDPLEEEQVEELRLFIQWLKYLDSNVPD
jgi:hypothetical protein